MSRRTHTLPDTSEARKDVPLYRGPLRYFPAALAGVAEVCRIGNEKHNPGSSELFHDRTKSLDHADCLIRHLVDLEEDFGHGKGLDENGVPQVFYIAWRGLALAQAWLEENRDAPYAPAAKNIPLVTGLERPTWSAWPGRFTMQRFEDPEAEG